MTDSGFSRAARAMLCLAAAVLLQGCKTAAVWDGVYPTDRAGGAKRCTAPPASPPDGQTVWAQMTVSNEGGWCGIVANRGGVPFDSYLMAARPAHGKVFAHRVGNTTRIDYFPDPGFTGADKFAVRMIPGGATIQGTVTVVR